MAYQVGIFLCFIPLNIKLCSNIVYDVGECISMITNNINRLLGRVHNTTIDNKLKLDARLLAHGLANFKGTVDHLTVHSAQFTAYRLQNYRRKGILNLQENNVNYKFSFTPSYFIEENNCYFHHDITSDRIYTLDELVIKVDMVAKLIITAHYGHDEYDLTSMRSKCDLVLTRQYTLWDVLTRFYDQLAASKSNNKAYSAVSDNTKRKRLNEATELISNVGGDDVEFLKDLTRVLKRKLTQISQSSSTVSNTPEQRNPSCGVDILLEGESEEQKLLHAITNKRVSLYKKYSILFHLLHILIIIYFCIYVRCVTHQERKQMCVSLFGIII